MHKLARRIELLEAAQNRVEDCPVFLLIHYSSTETGEVIGVQVNDTLTERQPGESEEALVHRAGAGLSGLVHVHQVRAKGSYVPPVPTVAAEAKSEKPKPEPVAARLMPKPT